MVAETERRTETIPEWKQEEVATLVDMIGRHDSVGIVEVAGIPSRQLQQMRAELHGSAEIRMGRNTLVRRALNEVDEGVEEVAEYVSGQVGLVGTDDNPFALYQRLEASKTPAPINAGDLAPKRIVIPAGDTGIDPGPFVGELQAVGAAARIEEGSIRVTEESVVADAGDVVSDRLANVLGELGIEPKEVGLNLRAVYADGVVFEADELSIDIDEYRADVQAAGARARNLSINVGYPTARTLPSMLAAASGRATAVGVAAAVESPDLADDLVSRADARVRALAALIDDDDALPEELRDVTPAVSAGPAEEQPAEATEAETETEDADAGDDEEGDDDEDDGSGAGLGDLFG